MVSKLAYRPFEELFSLPLRNGLTRPTSVRGEGVKMINMGEVFAHPRISNILMERVPLSLQEAERYLLESGDLLFARQSLVLSGAGKCSIFKGDSEPVTFEGHLIRARLNQEVADSDFYFYFFNSSVGRQVIETIVEQVAAAGIRASDLSKLLVPHPSIIEQRSIARILSSIDDKIELNQRMNVTLEETSRSIFKSWFVDFDPVRVKAEGRQPVNMDAEVASLFPDALEVIGDHEVPKGWGLGTLGEVADNVRRGIDPTSIALETPYIGLEHMPRRSIALSEWGQSDSVASNKFEFDRGNILFGKLRPYFHKVGVAAIDGVCSTDILVITPAQPYGFAFVLGHVSSDTFIQYTNNTSDGTKMPRTNWSDMARYEVVIPARQVVQIFNAIVTPFIELILTNIHRTRTLTTLRDTLLPKLLSGELRVQDAERWVETAM